MQRWRGSASLRGAGGRVAGRVVPSRTWHGAGAVLFVHEIYSFVFVFVVVFAALFAEGCVRGSGAALPRFEVVLIA